MENNSDLNIFSAMYFFFVIGCLFAFYISMSISDLKKEIRFLRDEIGRDISYLQKDLKSDIRYLEKQNDRILENK